MNREISLEPRVWFNPSAESRNFIIPGSITVIMTVIGALLTSLVVAREWERGTMEALLASPVTRTELLLCKILPYYGLGMVSLLLCVAVAHWVLRVPFRGTLPGAVGGGLVVSAQRVRHRAGDFHRHAQPVQRGAGGVERGVPAGGDVIGIHL